jgi:ATP-dependent RNA helicase DeaD
VGLAKTGTENSRFGLPILQLIDTNATAVQAVILVPTRELGHQIFRNLEAICYIHSKYFLQQPAVESQ